MESKSKPAKNNRVAFNLSLFDPQSSVENTSLISPNILNSNNNNNNNSGGSYNGIYDSSSSSLVTSTNLENTTFKTALTNETSYASINSEQQKRNSKADLIQKTLKKLNIDSRKKWMDILSAADEESSTSSIESLYEKALEQQLSFKSLDASSNSKQQINDDSLSSTNQSINSSIQKTKSNRKVSLKKETSSENRLDVAPANINLMQRTIQGPTSNTNNSNLKRLNSSKDLQLQALDDSNNSRRADRSLKQHSPHGVTNGGAITKEVIKLSTNFEKDLNIHKNEKSTLLNSSDSSQKNDQKQFLNDLFVS